MCLYDLSIIPPSQDVKAFAAICRYQPQTPFMESSLDSADPPVVWVAQALLPTLPQNQASGKAELHGIVCEKMSLWQGLA